MLYVQPPFPVSSFTHLPIHQFNLFSIHINLISNSHRPSCSGFYSPLPIPQLFTHSLTLQSNLNQSHGHCPFYSYAFPHSPIHKFNLHLSFINLHSISSSQCSVLLPFFLSTFYFFLQGFSFLFLFLPRAKSFNTHNEYSDSNISAILYARSGI